MTPTSRRTQTPAGTLTARSPTSSSTLTAAHQLLHFGCCVSVAANQLLDIRCCKSAAGYQLLQIRCCKLAAANQLLQISCCKSAPSNLLLHFSCCISATASQLLYFSPHQQGLQLHHSYHSELEDFQILPRLLVNFF